MSEEERTQIIARPTASYDEDDDDLLPIGDEQMYKCSRCNSLNSGYEEKEASLLTYISAILALLIFRLFAVMILPLLVESTKTVLRKCDKCDNVLIKQELLSVPSLTDKILNFKCGSCAIVISRKYAIIILFFISCIYFVIPSSSSVTSVRKGLFLPDAKFETYINDCGKNVLLNNGFRAQRNFDTKYYGNIIEWNGVIVEVTKKNILMHRGIDPNIFAYIFIKMIPTESAPDSTDILLLAGESLSAEEKEAINNVERGVQIKFRAAFIHLGSEVQPHSMELMKFDVPSPIEKVKIESIRKIEAIASSSVFRGTAPTNVSDKAN